MVTRVFVGVVMSALLLSGCSSDGDEAPDEGTDPSPTVSASPSPGDDGIDRTGYFEPADTEAINSRLAAYGAAVQSAYNREAVRECNREPTREEQVACLTPLVRDVRRNVQRVQNTFATAAEKPALRPECVAQIEALQETYSGYLDSLDSLLDGLGGTTAQYQRSIARYAKALERGDARVTEALSEVSTACYVQEDLESAPEE